MNREEVNNVFKRSDRRVVEHMKSVIAKNEQTASKNDQPAPKKDKQKDLSCETQNKNTAKSRS